MVAEKVSEPKQPRKKKEGEEKKALQRAAIMQSKFDLTPSCVHSITLIFGHIDISTQSLITEILTSLGFTLSNGKSLKGL